MDLPAAAVQPACWEYLVEGNLHIVLGFRAARPLELIGTVLRLRKQAAPGKPAASVEESVAYTTMAMGPLLGPDPFTEPGRLIRVNPGFLSAVEAEIRPLRPAHRLAAATARLDVACRHGILMPNLACALPLGHRGTLRPGQPARACAIDDLGVDYAAPGSRTGAGLCVEIKPKCGLLDSQLSRPQNCDRATGAGDECADGASFALAREWCCSAAGVTVPNATHGLGPGVTQDASSGFCRYCLHQTLKQQVQHGKVAGGRTGQQSTYCPVGLFGSSCVGDSLRMADALWGLFGAAIPRRQ